MTAPDARAWLDGLDQAREAATPGPWGYCDEIIGTDVRDLGPGSMSYKHLVCYIRDDDRECYGEPAEAEADAALIVAAVNALPELTARLRAVLDLADELDREAEAYAANVERLPTPTERASAAARAISHGGAADRLRAAVTAAQDGTRQ